MTVRSVSLPRIYAVALITFVIAFLIRLGLDPWLGKSVPYLLFYPAIFVAARYGGLGPGMLVTGLSVLAVVLRSFASVSTFSIQQTADLVAIVVFIVVGALISSLSESVRRAERDRGHLAAIVESSDDAIVSKDLNGVITSWNRGAERLFGHTAADAVGQPITIIIPPERLSEEAEVIRQIRLGNPVEHFETVRRRKDGSEVEVSITVSPIRDAAGTVSGASKIARDISERRRIEGIRADLVDRQRLASQDAESARERLAFLSEVGALIASSLDYRETLDRAVHLALPRLGDYCTVLVEDEHGQLRTVALGHVDREKEPLLSELVQRVIAPGGNRVLTFAERIMQSGRPAVVTHEMLLAAVAQIAPGASPDVVALGSQIRPYAYCGVPLSVRGRTVGVMSFGTTEDSRRDYLDADVAVAEEFARRVSIAVENARLFRQAGELNRLKDEFLATLSHELRTPLSAVLGWSRMLVAGQLDPTKTRQALEAIERNAQAQAKIVDDILDLARGTVGNFRLDLKPTDLVAVVQRSVEALAPAASAKQIKVEVRGCREVPMIADPDRLQQVVWNLLSNALKFTPAGGRVTLDVRVAGEQAEVQVTDTGVGITAAFLPYVFDKFRQADGSFTRQHGGLGLGLAIARHLIELHGGSIDALSEGEGSGATFVVRLPLPVRTV